MARTTPNSPAVFCEAVRRYEVKCREVKCREVQRCEVQRRSTTGYSFVIGSPGGFTSDVSTASLVRL